jgi:hypothetical protein
MRKNIAKVIEGFKTGVAVQGDVKRTCFTDGRNIYSYNMLIAKRFSANFGGDMIVVISDEYSPSVTTTKHIRAVVSAFDGVAKIVHKDSILTWDFKFSGNY